MEFERAPWSVVLKRMLFWSMLWLPVLAAVAYVFGGLVYGLTRPDFNPPCWRAPELSLIDHPAPFEFDIVAGDPPLMCAKAYVEDERPGQLTRLRLAWARCYRMEPQCP